MDELQRQPDPQEARAITGGGPIAKSALASEWFVQHYRLAFPKFAQDREYWSEIEAILREQFLNGGNAAHWRAACNDGKDAFKTPSPFTTIEGYRERVAQAKQASETKRTISNDGEPIDPEVIVLLTKLKEQMTLRSERTTGSSPQIMAAAALRTLDGAKEKGIARDRIVFHTLDPDADAVQGG